MIDTTIFPEAKVQILNELNAIFTNNYLDALKGAGVTAQEAGAMTMNDLALLLGRVNKTNSEVAEFIAGRFELLGDYELAGLCRNWSSNLRYHAQIMLDENQEAESRVGYMLAGIGGGLVDEQIFGRLAPKLGKFGPTGALLTAVGLLDAINDGDASQLAGVIASFAAGFVLTMVVSAAATALIAGATGLAAAPVIVALTVVAAVATVAVGSEVVGDWVDDIAESFTGKTDDETITEILNQLQNPIGQAYLPGIGYVFQSGTEANDVIQGDLGPTLPDSSNNPDLLQDAIVTGRGDDLVHAGDGNDYVNGGDDNDSLYGEAGKDALIGGEGNDRLNGGIGNDKLEGGTGDDTYIFSSSDFAAGATTDVIYDKDGIGKILFDSLSVSGTGLGFDKIKRIELSSWMSSDNQFRFNTHNANGTTDLIIVHRPTKSRIIVKDWSNGDLGITLPGYAQTNPPNSAPLSNENDAFGTAGNNVGNDNITALGGNDGISGGAGNDHLDGGVGNDLIFGGSGDDTVYGGEGDDEIIDGSEDPDFRELRTYADRADGSSERSRFEDEIVRLGSAIAARGTNWYIERRIASGGGNAAMDELHIIYAPSYAFNDPNQSRSGNDTIDAGAGNDRITAGEGEDTIVAGSGDDYVNGGHDDDTISGGDGNDSLDGDKPLDSIAGTHFGAAVSASAIKNGTDTIDGGEGDDSLRGGGGTDTLYGGNGNDNISGRGQGDVAADADDKDSDYIDGGSGNDTIFGDDGDDTILGGDGADNIRGDNGYSSVRGGNDDIDAGAGDDTARGDAGDDLIKGGAGADTLWGDAIDIAGDKHGRDTLYGGDGNDSLVGQGGNDTLYGDAGDDLLIGDMDESQLSAQHHGNDVLFGGLGNDTMYGNGGNDLLDGGAGADGLSGGTGDDRLNGGADNDLLDGGEGNDLLRGDDGDDQIGGGEGNDSLYGGAGIDLLDAGGGDDFALGGTGNDTFDGDDGNDEAYGEADNDYLDGDAGADRLFGGDGDDSIYGGTDNDSLYGDAGNDGINGAEGDDIVNGGSGDDILWGMTGNDMLSGGEGNDRIDGGEGDDVIDGGAGSDLLIGGAGTNAYVFAPGNGYDKVKSGASSGSYVQIAGGLRPQDVKFIFIANYTNQSYTGTALVVSTLDDATQLTIEGFTPEAGGTIDTIRFADGTTLNYQGIFERLNAGYFAGTTNEYSGSDLGETIQGRSGNDRIYGNGGNDTLYGNDGKDELAGDAGNDSLDGGSGRDYLRGGVGNDTLRGGLGHDYLEGDAGSDVLEGGDGDDTLDGSSVWDPLTDADTFIGGRGDDRLSGGNGSDLYVYNRGDGSDTIYDNGHLAAHGIDTLRFGAGIALSDLQFFRTSSNSLDTGDNTESDLVILINGGPEQIRVGSFFGNLWNDWKFQIERIEFANGATLDLNQITALAQPWGSASTLTGTEGNDIFVIDDRRDIIIDEFSTADRDTIRSSVSYGMDAYVDDLELTGIFHIDASGNDRNNVIVGNAGNNRINSGLGDDTVYAGAGNDTIDDGHGSNTLHGGDGNDKLTADGITAGVNQLFGEAGDDALTAFHNTHMDGGIGSDTYVAASRYGDTEARTLWIHESAADTSSVDVLDLTTDGYGSTREVALSDIKVVRSPALGQTWVQVLNTRIYIDTDANGNPLVEYLRISDTAQLRLSDLMVVNDAPTLQAPIGDIYLPIGQTTQIDILRTTIANEAWDTLKFSADYLPYGWSIDQTTGVITVVNSGSQLDTFIVTATDGSGQTLQIPLRFLHYTTIQGTAGADTLIGNYYPTVIYGYDGNDILTAEGDYTRLYGGAGNDIYNPNYYAVEIFENANEGIDTVNSRDASYTLGQNLENLNLTDQSAFEGYGNTLDNTITGNANANILYGYGGNDTLNGRGGADTLVGGAGNDSYVVDNASDVITELAGEGTDIVQASVSYTLSANVENLTLTGSSAINAAGNASANVLTGNSGNNTLTGGAGNDTLDGGTGSDTMVGGTGDDTYFVNVSTDVVTENASEGNDTVNAGIAYSLATLTNVENLTLTGTGNINGTGNAQANVLTGNSGNNQLDGGTGNDTMIGGLGNDTYLVDSASDVITELASEGTDAVQSSATYTLSANIETLTLTGTGAINGTGNDLANTLTGNSGNNTLTGGAGNDTINGSAGNDTMIGGTGDDNYTVDSASDVITELAGEGNDTVSAGITYSIASLANIENITLTGSGAINATGNAGANVLTGNTGNNTLTGGAGNDTIDGGNGTDTMVGGSGDDVYFVNVAADVVTENANEGIDTVNSAVAFDISTTARQHIEHVTLTGTGAINAIGNASANTLIGNTGNNALTGNAGNDTLQGMAGTDTLTGGIGNDTYLMARGYGVDTVVENDATAGNTDVARFLTGVAYDQLWFSRPSGSNNLEITIIGTSDKLVIKDWYLGAQYRTEEIRVVDGNRYVNAADVQTLVTAMATLTPPAAGQTTLSTAQRSALNAAFTSAWRTQATVMSPPSQRAANVVIHDSDDIVTTAASARTVVMSTPMPSQASVSLDDQIWDAFTPTTPGFDEPAMPVAVTQQWAEPSKSLSLDPDLPAQTRSASSLDIATGAMATNTMRMEVAPTSSLLESSLPQNGMLQNGMPVSTVSPIEVPGSIDVTIGVIETPTLWALLDGLDTIDVQRLDIEEPSLCDKPMSNETAALCGKPSALSEERRGANLSNCQRLVELMALDDGSGRELFAAAMHEPRRLETWTP
jgi:Ca2+-binding RTX toxin-like protein